MNIGLVTIAALLLLLPGVGFIVGVNFADKNVREIVFRNTPAELGYVVIISVVVHLGFALAARHWVGLAEFNSAYLYAHFLQMEKAAALDPKAAGLDSKAALDFLITSLEYYLSATLAGTVPGYLLGMVIRRPFHRWIERFVAIFVKHRWLMSLVRRSRQGVQYAYVLLKDPFAETEMTAGPGGLAGSTSPATATKVDFRVVIHGIVQDSFFASDGTLLYMVFESYTAVRADGSTASTLKGMDDATARDGGKANDVISGPLVIEGRNVALVRFSRVVRMPRAVLDALKQQRADLAASAPRSN